MGERDLRSLRDAHMEYRRALSKRVTQSTPSRRPCVCQSIIIGLFYPCSRSFTSLLPQDIDEHCRKELQSLPEVAALEAVDKLAAADLSKVRKIPFFFLNILRRYKKLAAEPILFTSKAAETLPEQVRERFEILFESKVLQRSDLDSECFKQADILKSQHPRLISI